MPTPSNSFAPSIPTLIVFDKLQQFCCPACHAVCETIIQAGLESYYQHRSELPQSIEGGNSGAIELPDASALALYDRADIKKEFVSSRESLEEACLLLEDIHCSACVWLNEHHLRKLAGIEFVSVDSVTHRALVRWDPHIISLSQILLAIQSIGYRAHPYNPEKHRAQLADRNQKSSERLIFAGVLGMFVMQFSFSTYFMGFNQADVVSEMPAHLPAWEEGGRWASLLICFMLLAYPGQTFFVGGWRAIRAKQVSMDVPIVLGLSVAFLGSAWATFSQQGPVYFEAIAMFVFLVLLSRRWELKGQLYSSRYLSRLNQQKLKTALRINQHGETQTIAVKDLNVGDRVMVLPGASVPVDGLLRSSHAELDESLITGESRLQQHVYGDTIRAGCVNGCQQLLLKVSKTAEFSTIEGINRLVLHGMENKPDSEQLVHRVASQFVVAVLSIAAITLIYWLWREDPSWLSNSIAVLIVTCPCALALAIPVAHSIAAGRLLENGVLPINMSSIMAMAKAKTIVFDKTGTLTDNHFKLEGVCYEKDVDKTEVASLLVSLATRSEHPLSKAIIRYSDELARKNPKADGVHLDQFANHAGYGIEASNHGRQYRLGSLRFVAGSDTSTVRLSESMQIQLDSWCEQGYQLVAFAERDQTPQVILAFSNRLREGSEALTAGLDALGFDYSAILSGDHTSSVRKLSKQLEFKHYFAEQAPEDKLTIMTQLQKGQANGSAVGEGVEHRQVIMVGDGINDSATLAAADVSISLASATDLAQLNSDFVLLGNDLSAIALIRKVAVKTRRIVYQNLFWAVAYNLLLVPAAAAGFVQPWLAALGMSLSSLLVVSNSLRLRRMPLNINTKRSIDNGTADTFSPVSISDT